MEAIGEDVLGCVGEDVRGAAGDDAGEDEVREVGVPGYFAEADDETDPGQGGDLGCEMRGAVADLFRERLVRGWGAADDGGDPGVFEPKAVGKGGAGGLVGEAHGVEDRVHEVAGAVSGEDAAGTVGSVGSGGEAEDEDAGARIAEARDGARPVFLVDVGAAAGLAYGFAVGAEAGAASAGDDFGSGFKEGRHSKDDRDLSCRTGARGGQRSLRYVYRAPLGLSVARH